MGGDPFLPGYALYVAAVLLPGYGLGEFFGRWKPSDGALQRIGLSMGYGMAIDTVILAVATLGLRFGPFDLVGIPPALVYSIVCLGAVLLFASFVKKRKLETFPRLGTSDLVVALCSGAMVAIIWLYFQKYPIFPTFYNPDYYAIVRESAGLIGGTLNTIPKMLLYGAGTYQTAAAFLFVGTPNLITAEVSMSILVVLSPFLVYAVASRMFGGSRAPLLATIIYSLSGVTWAQMVYSDGLYPNFVGVLLQLTLLVAFLDLSASLKSRAAIVPSAVVLIASYFAHYTVLAVLGSFAIVALVFLMTKSPNSRGTLVTSLLFLAPGALGLVFFGQTLLKDIAISYQSGAQQALTTPLSNLLSFVPSVAYLAFDVRNDVGFAVLILLLAAAMYKGLKLRDVAIVLPLVWFLGLLVAAPQDYSAWRFSLEALVPLTLLAGYGLEALMPKRRMSKIRRLKSADPYRFGTIVVGVLLLTPVVAVGWASTFAQSLVPNSAAEAQTQNQVLLAMRWLGENTTPSSNILSITDPTFLYTHLFVDRNCSYGYHYNETEAIAYARQAGYGYLIVTRLNVYYSLLTPAPRDSASYLPWFTYSPTPDLKLVYTNPDVKIFQINGTQ